MKAALFSIALATPVMAGTPEIDAARERESFLSTLFAGTQRVDAEVEGLTSDDIRIWRESLTYEQDRDDWIFTAAAAHRSLEIDYRPTIVTSPAHRREDTWEGSLEIARRLSSAWEVSLSGRAYDGFADYRSLWIAEYYDQFVGFLPGYEKADPHGLSATLEAAWDYLPRTGQLTAAFTFGRDTIVPAWSALGLDLERTRDVLDTFSGSLAWQAALSPRVKMQHTLRATQITAREPRVQFQSEAAWALTDRLTLRAHAGGAREQPDFDAWYGGLALDCRLAPQWHAQLTARLYEDSGEISSSNFNTAAPGVATRELALSLLWSNDITSLRLSVGHYDTDYAPLDDNNLFFGNLYCDRDFLTTRLAFTHYF